MAQGPDSPALPYDFARHGDGIIETVISELRSSDETARYARYQRLLFLFFCVLSLLWAISLILFKRAADRRALRRRGQELILRIALFGAAAIAFAELLLLPVNFGKLIVPNKLPVVLVMVDNEALAQQVPSDRRFLLLVKNNEDIVLYDLENPVWESIVILKRNHVSSMRVVGTKKAF